jgi:putative hydrolase of the HAD superfamily
MAPLDAVCFDLDSTLCLSNQSDQEIHEAVFERAGVDPCFTPEDVRAVDTSTVEPAESDAEFYANLYAAAVRDLSVDPDRSLLERLGEITADVVDETDVSFRPGAQKALEYASDRYPVGLITNGGETTQSVKLDRLGIADVFEVTVFCDPGGGIEPKPAVDPFERALADLPGDPEKTVYIGDSHSSDVVGAHRTGLQSIWVPPNRPHGSQPTAPDPAPTHRLDSMADLPTLL